MHMHMRLDLHLHSGYTLKELWNIVYRNVLEVEIYLLAGSEMCK